MVDKTATRAGKKFEGDIVKYLREQGIRSERLHLSGSLDEGDLWFEGNRLVVVEAKRTREFTPAQWVKEAQAEARNFAKARALAEADTPYWGVVSARRNHGIGDAYVITTLSEWLRQVS